MELHRLDPPQMGSSAPSIIRVMTFNLRFDNPNDGVHDWLHRRQLVVELINKESPDLLATQEGTPKQLEFLSSSLKGYAMAAPWREADADPKMQCPTIFYRTDTFRMKGGGEFWLSETPNVYRSKSWGSAYPRMFTFARFSISAARREFWFGDTHLDNISEDARVHGARLIARWVKRRRLPVILAGDFNDHPGSRVHKILTEDETQLVDSWFEFVGREDQGPSTVHHFTGKPVGNRVDWVLVSDDIKVHNAMVLDVAFGGQYPSDHYPYLVDVELPG